MLAIFAIESHERKSTSCKTNHRSTQCILGRPSKIPFFTLRDILLIFRIISTQLNTVLRNRSSEQVVKCLYQIALWNVVIVGQVIAVDEVVNTCLGVYNDVHSVELEIKFYGESFEKLVHQKYVKETLCLIVLGELFRAPFYL